MRKRNGIIRTTLKTQAGLSKKKCIRINAGKQDWTKNTITQDSSKNPVTLHAKPILLVVLCIYNDKCQIRIPASKSS